MSARAMLIDRTHERAYAWIGHVTSDEDWRSDHWVDIPPEAFKAASKAGAEGDQAQVGAIFDQHFVRIAYREAEAKFGVTLA